MYWTNFWHPTTYVPQNIFEKTLLEVCIPHLYTSFGTFFVPTLVNYSRHSEFLKYVRKSTNRCDRRKMSSFSEFFIMFKDSLCRVIDQFWRKKSQKKRKDVDYIVQYIGTYVIPRTVYFDWICTYFGCYLYSKCY